PDRRRLFRAALRHSRRWRPARGWNSHTLFGLADSFRGTRMVGTSKLRLIQGLALTLGVLSASAPPARAVSVSQALKQGWECVKASAKGVVAINKDLLEKG